MQSYQHVTIRTIEAPGPQGMIRRASRFTLALARPNKFCFHGDDFTTDAAVSDGKTFVNFRAQQKEYIQIPAPASYRGINIIEDVLFHPVATYIVALMLQGDVLADRVIKEGFQHATLEKNVEWNHKKWTVVNFPFSENMYRFYFDRDTRLLTRAEMRIESRSVVITESIENIRINQSIPSATFTIRLPANAKRVAKLPDLWMDLDLSRLPKRFEGKPAPNFTLNDRNGRDISLSDFHGKVVVLNFWASWCPDCRRALPMMQELQEKLADQGVAVVGVNTWDSEEAARRFLKENKNYTMTMLLDPAERIEADSIASRLFGARTIPTTLIIDRNGVVQKYLYGPHSRKIYLDALQKAGIRTVK
jgi:peroxiredoxin/outer membrane lipoprotein-sorting protein